MQFHVNLYLDNQLLDPSDYSKVFIKNQVVDEIINSIVDAAQQHDDTSQTAS